ncbi:MAG: hypothetical protein WD294_07170 [Phycisphaeraceae bacterium]
MHPEYKTYARQRGIVAVLAMMFLVIFSSLAAAMAIVAQGNLRSAESFQHVNRSLVAAETGMSFFNWQLAEVANTITTPNGVITEDLADEIWPILREAILTDIGEDGHYLTSHEVSNGEELKLGKVAMSGEDNPPTFEIVLQRHPIAGEDYGRKMYQRRPYNVGGGDNKFTTDGEAVTATNAITGVWVRIRSIGRDDDYTRSVEMDFRIDKKIRYAILSRNRVMIGRNVMIRGSIGSRYTHTDYEHGHPVQMLDDFRGLDDQLDEWLATFTDYLADNDQSGNNRIRLADLRESGNLEGAADYDLSGDGYVDAYDLFLMRFGDDAGGVPMANFTDASGELINPQLWQMINEFKYPPGTDFDWGNLRVKEPGDVWRNAKDDLAYIGNEDMYAKIDGEVVLLASKDAWQAGAGGGQYQDYFQGPIVSDDDTAPLTFEADDASLSGLEASDFNVDQYRAMAENDFQQQVDAGAGIYSPAGSGTREAVPFESAHPYDYYERPVYENYVFENVVIPKGTNALFVNCTFRGVTFVDTNTENSDPYFNVAGTQTEDGSLLYEHVMVDVNGELVNDTKGEANNIRFHNSTFEGIVVAEPPAEFSHVRNKLQFTGATAFDLDAPSVGENRALFQRSTLLAPHYSVDMGTFVDPDNAAKLIKLDGTIVAGVLDVRGQAVIDGSLITTYEANPDEGPLTHGGSPAAFNTTLGYFGSEDGDAEAELPEGGEGKIIIRYDPTRALPDGINGPIEVRPVRSTYIEAAG